jgi:hypothetical protein
MQKKAAKEETFVSYKNSVLLAGIKRALVAKIKQSGLKLWIG